MAKSYINSYPPFSSISVQYCIMNQDTKNWILAQNQAHSIQLPLAQLQSWNGGGVRINEDIWQTAYIVGLGRVWIGTISPIKLYVGWKKIMPQMEDN